LNVAGKFLVFPGFTRGTGSGRYRLKKCNFRLNYIFSPDAL
jgi:hypothetical protein